MDNLYRYAYQGQEKDPETGKEAFQLRLWDGRIGRWLSPDPMGQYHSPYMAMDNTPQQSVDPTGGCTDCSECPSACGDLGVTSIPSGQSIDLNIDSGYFMRSDLSSSMLNEVFVYNPSYTPVPSNILGTTDYYQYRHDNFLQKYPGLTPPNYYLDYGNVNIIKFANLSLSNAGNEWSSKTRLRLQTLMEEGLRNSNGKIEQDNDAFRTFAFDTHVPAYVESGLLELPLWDKIKIANTPSLGHIFNKDGIKQGIIIINMQAIHNSFNASASKMYNQTKNPAYLRLGGL